MKISNKLMVITFLTLLQIVMSLWAIMEVSKGAKFHQLNIAHLKHTTALLNQIEQIERNNIVKVESLQNALLNIAQQPQQCLAMLNIVNRIAMTITGTTQVIALCKKDAEQAQSAINMLERFKIGTINQAKLLREMRMAQSNFQANSIAFEEPVQKVLQYVIRVFVPLVGITSLINILFILYIYRSISKSIQSITKVLANQGGAFENSQLKQKTNGELQELLSLAKQRTSEYALQHIENTELERLVALRTASLTRANNELAEFAYRTSYDLKEPLSASKLLAQFIVRHIDSNELNDAKRDANKIITQMITLEELVSRMFELNAANEDCKAAEMSNIHKLFEQVKTTFTGLAETANVNIKVFCQPDLRCKIPLQALTHTLENLVSNAIKYASAERNNRYVSLVASIRDNCLSIKVADNGIGIAREHHHEVFNMFKRFHPNISHGSGLGLAIVKKYITTMQGSIDFESSQQGTTFSLTIPHK